MNPSKIRPLWKICIPPSFLLLSACTAHAHFMSCGLLSLLSLALLLLLLRLQPSLNH